MDANFPTLWAWRLAFTIFVLAIFLVPIWIAKKIKMKPKTETTFTSFTDDGIKTREPCDLTLMRPAFVFQDVRGYSQLDVLRMMCMNGRGDVLNYRWRVSEVTAYFLIQESARPHLEILFPECPPGAKSIVVTGERLMERCAIVSQFDDCTLQRLIDEDSPWDLEIFQEGLDPLVFTFIDERLCLETHQMLKKSQKEPKR